VREWVGDRVFNEMRAADYTLANKLWEDSILIKKTDLADDRHGIYNPLAAMMGVRAAQHPDKLFFTALVANGTCFDGQAFFSASHSFGDSGTQSNSLTLDAATGTTRRLLSSRLRFAVPSLSCSALSMIARAAASADCRSLERADLLDSARSASASV
jgi:phage major head subunit gpT-like protein